jgi:thiol:disulfide interchange protein DsbD
MIATMTWLLALLLLQDMPSAQDDDKGGTKLVSLKVQPAEAKVGQIIELTVTIEVDKDWHIYPANIPEMNKTEFAFDEQPVVINGKIREPVPHDYTPKVGDKQKVHEGTVTFVVPIQIKEGNKPGDIEITGTVSGQVCQDLCKFFSHDLKFKLKVLEGKIDNAPPPPQPETSQDNLLSGGFLGFLGLCILGGLVSLIMPCVYPLVPITLTYFVKQGAGNRAKSLGLSSAYAIGIIISFTAIGMILSVILGEDGARVFAADPWVNLVIATMFVVFALSLFGLFEIQLPSGFTNAVAGSPRSGIFGAFILGLTFSVVTFTCTIPIAAGLLALAATGSGGWAFIGMLVYSATMALPFMLLGLFPGALGKVPKSGGWLHNVKIVAAFVEIALAVKYFANVDFAWQFNLLSRDFGIIVWGLCTILAGVYLLGLFKFKEDTPVDHVGVARLFIAMALLGLGVFMFTGLNDKPLGGVDALLPPIKEKFEWIENYEKGLEEAKRTNKPIFIDFTGFT